MSVVLNVRPLALVTISVSVAGKAIKLIMDDVNNNSNSNSKTVVNSSIEQKSLTLKTNIRNSELLAKALVNLGTKDISINTIQIEGEIDNFRIVFEQDKEGVFDIKFIGEIEEKEAQKFVDELQSEYGKVVQEFVYVKLKEKAIEKGLDLEQENVQNDQSIVLTYNING